MQIAPPALILLLGCVSPAPPGDRSPPGATPGDTGAPLPVDSGGGGDSGTDTAPVPAPEWAAEAIEAHLAAALAAPWPSAPSVAESMNALMATGDEICPGRPEASAATLSDACLGGCTASTGTHCLGIGGYETHRFEDGVSSGYTLSLVSEFALTGPDGRQLTGAGHWTAGVFAANDGTGGAFSKMEGSWHDTGATGWLTEGASGWHELQVDFDQAGTPQATVRQVLLHGVVSGAGTSMAFDRLQLSHGQCPNGLVGSIGLRDPSGYWWWLDLEDPCTEGCGSLRLDDQDVGTLACIQTDAFLALALDGVPA